MKKRDSVLTVLVVLLIIVGAFEATLFAIYREDLVNGIIALIVPGPEMSSAEVELSPIEEISPSAYPSPEIESETPTVQLEVQSDTPEPAPTVEQTDALEPSETISESKPPPEAETTAQQSNSGGVTVYITATGSKYHSGWCQYLSNSKIAISLNAAKAQGYTPCSVCRRGM